MDQIKDSFQKVKVDMDFLFQEFDKIRQDLDKTKQEMSKISAILSQITEKITSTQPTTKPTTSTHSSTHDYALEPLKPQNMPISTGNQGVPTDRQTDRQQGNRHENQAKIQKIKTPNSIDAAAEILDSLDNIKKEIRLKFKRLTDQEVLVFSTLYQVDEETGPTNYKTLADKLGLTESSIRDYVGRLIKKGIPVDKKRINNKTIQLSISQNLKKIASLPTILQLRDI